jgi:cell wall assembly regulator SMI1
VQKFTRALTREIEVNGERLAVTLGEEGLSIRPVGSRKPPRTLTWSEVLCACAGKPPAGGAPTTEERKVALQGLRSVVEGASAPAAPPLSDSLSRLEKWLKKNRPDYLAGLQPGAKAADLKEPASAIGAVPDELQTWLSWHNGQSEDFIGAFIESFQMLSSKEIASAYKECVAGSGWQKTWIPFLADGQGDFVCLDTAESNHPIRAVWRGRPEAEVVAASLAAWAAGFVGDVEEGRYHEDPERGDFIRSSQ